MNIYYLHIYALQTPGVNHAVRYMKMHVYFFFMQNSYADINHEVYRLVRENPGSRI